MEYSEYFSTAANAPRINALNTLNQLLIANDPMNMQQEGFDLGSVAVGAKFVAFTSAGYELLDFGYFSADSEHLIMLDDTGTIWDAWVYNYYGQYYAYMESSQTDLNARFPGNGNESLTSMVLGEDGNVYVSIFNGASCDLYMLEYNSDTESYTATFMNNFGEGVYPVILTGVTGNSSAATGALKQPSEDMTLIQAETFSEEELAGAEEASAADEGNLLHAVSAMMAQPLNTETSANAAAGSLNAFVGEVEGEESQYELTITADEAVNNGKYTVTYDPSGVELVGVAVNAAYKAVNTAEKGTVVITFTDLNAIQKDGTAAVLTFKALSSRASEIAVTTDERNDAQIGTCETFTIDPPLPFVDVDESHWFYDAVNEAYEMGLINGMDDTHFGPNLTMTRAMLVTILHRMEGKPAAEYTMGFEDVASDAWYTEAVRWAASEGIVDGYSDTAFGPEDPVTRQQSATILWRYAKHKGMDVGSEDAVPGFKDRDDVASWAAEAVSWPAAGVSSRADPATIWIPTAEPPARRLRPFWCVSSI